jgi:uncharacterized protein HemX
LARDALLEAEQERAAAEARAQEERKRRRLAVALAAVVLGALGLGGTAAVWYQLQQARLDQEEALRQAEAARRRQGSDTAAMQAMAETRLMLDQARAAAPADASRFREAVAAAVIIQHWTAGTDAGK